MDSLDQLKKSWNEAKGKETGLQQEDVKQMIAKRIRKEKRTFFEYFWTSYAWQFLIYVSLTRLTILFWGDWMAVLFCLAGILLYVPFTFLLIRKFASWALPATTNQDIKSRLKNQFSKMSEFFRFKKGFDWIGVPFSSFMITFIVFRLWVPGDWTLHPMGAALTFSFTLFVFIIVTFDENKRKFKKPLYSLQQVVKEMEE